MKQRAWTSAELARLKAMAPLGAEEIARRMGRTVRSVRCAAYRYRISLRRTARGTVLGQKVHRGSRFPLDRKKALSLDMTAEEERIRNGGQLCPACGTRLVTMKATGMCESCHYRRLAQRIRERDDAEESRRGYYREKAKAKRRTTCRECGAIYAPRLDSEGRISDREICPDCRDGEAG